VRAARPLRLHRRAAPQRPCLPARAVV
jgi:hypothetical protein